MFKLDNIKFTPQDILHKQFKERNIGKGYGEADVDAFLDDVIKDYDTYNKELERLNDENERLRAKVDELNKENADAKASFKKEAKSKIEK